MPDLISDGQTLLLILVLLYLAECLIWVKKQSVVFVAAWGPGWRVATPISWLGNANGALLILNPLPPPGRVFQSHLLPISISPAGVCAFSLQTLPSGARSATQTGEFVAFSDITEVKTDGSVLVIDGRKFAKCATAKQAKELAQLITSAKDAKAARRETLITSWIAKQFDATVAKRVWTDAEQTIGPVRWMCSLFFVFLFVATPVVVSLFGLERLIIPIAVGMVLLAWQIAFLFYRTHRTFYTAESHERFENLLKMILCPPVALRAADVLTKNLLSQFSPVAVASVLAGPGEKEFVRDVVRDLQHPLKHEITDQKAADTIGWMGAQQLKACLALVERVERFKGLPGAVLREGDSVAYCPRCAVQFVMDEGECPDCPGVGLVAFSADEQEVTLSQTSG